MKLQCVLNLPYLVSNLWACSWVVLLCCSWVLAWLRSFISKLECLFTVDMLPLDCSKTNSDWWGLGLHCFLSLRKFVGCYVYPDAEVSWDPGQSYHVIFLRVFFNRLYNFPDQFGVCAWLQKCFDCGLTPTNQKCVSSSKARPLKLLSAIFYSLLYLKDGVQVLQWLYPWDYRLFKK